MTLLHPCIIAHLRKDRLTGEWHFQSNDDHCKGVADLAMRFADEFGMGEFGRLIGLLHDRGKERDSFQTYIRKQSGYMPALKTIGDKDHSFVGAVLCQGYSPSCFLPNIVLGHHRGLYDCIDLKKQLDRELPREVSTELPAPGILEPAVKPDADDFSHLTRMLFSCLVDADYLDTQRFMDPDSLSRRVTSCDMGELDTILKKYIEKFESAPATPLNLLRRKIQALCYESGKESPGFFELTVPTGGGKTLASMLWAVSHALAHGKKRIIVAIPFTSIIVQTAEVLRAIFGDENVLEHHSVVNTENLTESTKLATENWDVPIVVTTNVQLFESMFSNRPSTCRKLHALANSVVILDEVQALPTSMLQPIVNAMKSYAKLFGTSFLFCTASQPVLTGERKGMGTASFHGIDTRIVRPIIASELNLHDHLRRVSIVMPRHGERVSIEEVVGQLASHNRVLCVVNSRATAIGIYNLLSETDPDNTFHLSRTMCSDHLAKTIRTIRERLQADDNTPLRVVSTQLIEAGVDIDFPVVYRQLSGLDSIIQAAGRCNREGNAPEAKAYVFELNGKRPKTGGYLAAAADAMRELLNLNPDSDWLAPETMTLFYRKLYTKTPSFDIEGIVRLNNFATGAFEEIAHKFKLIDDCYEPVIVNYGEASALVEKLRQNGPSRSLLKKLGRFTVTIPRRDLTELKRSGLAEEPFAGFNYVSSEGQYDEKTGLRTDNSFLEQTLIK